MCFCSALHPWDHKGHHQRKQKAKFALLKKKKKKKKGVLLKDRSCCGVKRMINKDKKNLVQQGKCSVTARLISGRLAANAECLLQRCASSCPRAVALSRMYLVQSTGVLKASPSMLGVFEISFFFSFFFLASPALSEFYNTEICGELCHLCTHRRAGAVSLGENQIS